MKVLIFNGSPKLNSSNTLQLTNAFLEGMAEKVSLDKEILTIYKMNIKPCRGCFNCWTKTPGKCCINDDMQVIIDKIIEADIIVWSFPLYYYGVPSQLKALMDRQLPMILPYMSKADYMNGDNGGHPSRYDMSGKRYVLISTCGFYTSSGNYDSINMMFDKYLGEKNYETIYCGQGELFRVPEVRNRTREYLMYVKKAGYEFGAGCITLDTKEHLSELLYPRNVFEQMADASWDISSSEKDENIGISKTNNDMSLMFTKQMAALYNPESWKIENRVLEIHYTDIDKRYQIVLGKEKQEVLTEGFKNYTTKIETPFTVWKQISTGEIDGQTALIKHLYRVDGDFDLMMNWEKVFGYNSNNQTYNQEIVSKSKTNMNLLLLPWIVTWVAIPINQFIGGILSIAVCSLLPFAFLKWKITVFECLSILAVSIFGVLSLSAYPTYLIIPASYLIFGIIWSWTATCKVPLTAYYSMYGYGEETALSNPLFIRTNRILTACWGVLYMVTPIWTYFLMQSEISQFVGAINSVLPMILGMFTKWFQKWYPPYYANKPRKN